MHLNSGIKYCQRGRGVCRESFICDTFRKYSARHIDVFWDFTFRYFLQQEHIFNIQSLYKDFPADSSARLRNIKGAP